MKYFVIADDSRCVELFRAIGVDGICAMGVQEAKTAVEHALQDGDIGTLLLSKSVFSLVSELVEQHRRTGLFPEVVTLDR